MIFKLGLLISCLFATVCVATEETAKPDENFSVEAVWKKSAPCGCTCAPDWAKPVQEYYDAAINAFSSFPEQVAQPADLVKSTFQAILTKVIEFSNSPSDILSAGATGILESFAQVKLEIETADGIIKEFTRVLPILMESYRKVIRDMTNVLGCALVDLINTDITDLELTFLDYVRKFETGDGKGRKIEIDYEPVMKRVQKLTDDIALKGDVKLTECQLEDPDVQDALVILSCVLDYIMVLVHGLSSSSEAVILEQPKCEPPKVLRVIIVSVGVFVSELTDSLIVNTAPKSMNVLKHVSNLGKSASKLSKTLTALFKTVEQLTKTVTGTVTNTLQGLLKPIRLIG